MSSYTSSSDPWAHSGYNATAAHLEREFASNPDQNFQSFSSASGSRGYSQQQHLQAAPQSAQLPGLDRNLWPQRSMAGGLTPTGYPVNAMPRSNSIHNYHQQTFAPELTNPQLYTNNPSQSYLPPTHLGQQSMFNSNQDQSGAYQSGLPSAGFPSSSPAMTQTSLPMSSHPTSPVTPPVGPPYFQAPPPSSTRTGHTDLVRKNSATNKRIRLSGPDFPRDEDGDSDELLQESPEATKAKPPGACARCKELKVKCEFRTETDPCRRCLNAGRECVIPGRKKRRTPPKREHLLNQIREQAEQIQNLMAKLEESNKEGPGSGTSENFALPSSRTNASLHSPILSPSTTFPSASSVFETNKVVEDWISKARESLAEFGGFIGLGGSGTNIPKSYLMEKDVEDSSSSDEDYVDAQTGDDDIDGGYGIAVVEAADGNEWAHVTPEGAKLSRASSNSSQHAKQKKDDASSKLATLPSEAVPFGLMAQLSLKNHRRLSQHQPDKMETNEDEEGNQLGVASADFFRLSPEPETRGNAPPPVNLPHILTRNIISVEEAEHLFKIYFDKMNLSCSNLDPVLYTAQRTCFRSPFLFTTICAIASRFYVERPDLYPQAMHYAQLAAGTSLLSGPKSVEMCHAYLLLSLYPVPARRYEEDRSWIFLGLAIRIAIDLNLHIPVTAQPKNENHAREMLNRTRCYLNLCNVDRSMGSQYGKHPILPSTDYIACHSADWWRSSPFNMKHFDIQLCCYNEELRTLAKFRNKIYSDPEHPTGLNRRVDFDLLCKETDDELQALKAKWMTLIEENTDMNDLQNRFRTGLLRLAFSYARLAVLSFGFQHAFDKNNADEVLLRRCLTAAKDVVNVLLLDIGRPETKIYLRHGPDAQRVFVTFAAAFMVKLLQPKFVTFLPVEERLEIRRLVKSVADLLGSPEIAVDERHGPKLYSRFLKGLLATPMAKVVVDAKQLQDLRQQRQQHGGGPGSPGTLPSSVYSSPSPEAGLSSPPPNQAAMSFDQFTETAPIDPFAPATMMHHQQNGALGASPESSSGMDAFFSPPLPFDHEILSSMQSLTDPNVWQDSMLPGFNWMSSYQSQSPPPNNPSQNYSQFYQ